MILHSSIVLDYLLISGPSKWLVLCRSNVKIIDETVIENNEEGSVRGLRY